MHLCVGHARAADDHAVVQRGIDDAATGIDLHDARLHETIDVRPERAQAGGQFLREHVNGALGEVHRRGALGGLAIQRTVLMDVVRHVRDMHLQQVVAVRQPFDRYGIVEIAGRLAVDGDDDIAAEIGASLDVLRVDLHAEPRGFGNALVRMAIGDAVLADDDLGVDAGSFEVADDLDHACRARRGRAPASA